MHLRGQADPALTAICTARLLFTHKLAFNLSSKLISSDRSSLRATYPVIIQQPLFVILNLTGNFFENHTGFVFGTYLHFFLEVFPF